MPTKIEWAEETWNPVVGCAKVSTGCKNCYAERMARRLKAMGILQYQDVIDKNGWTNKISLVPKALEKPLHWRKSKRIFVCSMSDLFHKDVPFWFVRSIWTTMAMCTQHIFMVLTKRPERMLEFVNREWPTEVIYEHQVQRYTEQVRATMQDVLPNVWLGVTAENQETANERIPILLQIPAAVRFVSLEPLLGPVDLYRAVYGPPSSFLLSTGAYGWPDYCNIRNINGLCGRGENGGLNWIIAGGESGPGARPVNVDWLRSVRDQCTRSGTSFLFKQWGAWAVYESVDGRGPLPRGQVHWFDEPTGAPDMVRVGKKAAGRKLDGREWNEYPKMRKE